MRNLALYPDCVNIKITADKVACCDKAVKSASGRSFCYNEKMIVADSFIGCNLGDLQKNFACCDKMAEGDQNLAYVCKMDNPDPLAD